MGRQLKKKDPSKKKKKAADDSASGDAVARQNKNGVAAKAIAGVSARLKARPSAPATRSARQSTTGIRGYINQGIQFLKEVQAELKKVYWPSRKQAAGSTVVVIVLVILVSLFLGMADFGLSNIMQLIIG